MYLLIFYEEWFAVLRLTAENTLTIFAGSPVLVQVSVSLRNILEIDEHKQVSYTGAHQYRAHSS